MDFELFQMYILSLSYKDRRFHGSQRYLRIMNWDHFRWIQRTRKPQNPIYLYRKNMARPTLHYSNVHTQYELEGLEVPCIIELTSNHDLIPLQMDSAHLKTPESILYFFRTDMARPTLNYSNVHPLYELQGYEGLWIMELCLNHDLGPLQVDSTPSRTPKSIFLPLQSVTVALRQRSPILPSKSPQNCFEFWQSTKNDLVKRLSRSEMVRFRSHQFCWGS